MTRINLDVFKEALKGTAGVLSDVAAKLNVSRAAVSLYVQRTPKAAVMAQQEREKLIDVAENVFKEALSLQTKDTKDKKLGAQVKRDNMRLKLKAAEKVVTTLGKKRGWIPREERELSGEISHTFEPVKINVIMPNVKKEETPAPPEESKEGQREEEEKITDETDASKEE